MKEQKNNLIYANDLIFSNTKWKRFLINIKTFEQESFKENIKKRYGLNYEKGQT